MSILYDKSLYMYLKITLNYSPNFSSIRRIKKNIKFIVYHYTGMRSETKAINWLTNVKSKVSSNYFIKRNGQIICLVPDLYISWHAGKSRWKNFRFLNKNSIGIEIVNKGHQFGYQKFSKKQISNLIKLSRFLIKKFSIKRKNILGHSDIAFNRKKDPGEKFPWQYLSKKGVGIWHNLQKKILIKARKTKIDRNYENKFYKYLRKFGYFTNKLSKKQKINLLKAFQRRFRPELVNGKIDQECFLIAKKLSKL